MLSVRDVTCKRQYTACNSVHQKCVVDLEYALHRIACLEKRFGVYWRLFNDAYKASHVVAQNMALKTMVNVVARSGETLWLRWKKQSEHRKNNYLFAMEAAAQRLTAMRIQVPKMRLAGTKIRLNLKSYHCQSKRSDKKLQAIRRLNKELGDAKSTHTSKRLQYKLQKWRRKFGNVHEFNDAGADEADCLQDLRRWQLRGEGDDDEGSSGSCTWDYWFPASSFAVNAVVDAVARG